MRDGAYEYPTPVGLASPRDVHAELDRGQLPVRAHPDRRHRLSPQRACLRGQQVVQVAGLVHIVDGAGLTNRNGARAHAYVSDLAPLRFSLGWGDALVLDLA